MIFGSIYLNGRRIASFPVPLISVASGPGVRFFLPIEILFQSDSRQEIEYVSINLDHPIGVLWGYITNGQSDQAARIMDSSLFESLKFKNEPLREFFDLIDGNGDILINLSKFIYNRNKIDLSIINDYINSPMLIKLLGIYCPIPDILILTGTLALQGDNIDSNVAKELFISAWQKGIPWFSKSIQLLYEGVRLVGIDAFPENMINYINDIFKKSDRKSTFTVFHERLQMNSHITISGKSAKIITDNKAEMYEP